MKKYIYLLLILLISSYSSYVLAVNLQDAGWVDVPLKDTQPFGMSCEYRVYRGAGPDDTLYPYVVKAAHLMFDIANEGQRYYRLDANNKTIIYNPETKVQSAQPTVIQKRCTIPETTPAGAIVTFALDKCPDGWSKLPTLGKTADNDLLFCKKN